MKTEFGFDDAFNYKTEKDWNAALTKYANSLPTFAESQIILTLKSCALQHFNNNSKDIRIPTCLEMLKISISRLFTLCVCNVGII